MNPRWLKSDLKVQLRSDSVLTWLNLIWFYLIFVIIHLNCWSLHGQSIELKSSCFHTDRDKWQQWITHYKLQDAHLIAIILRRRSNRWFMTAIYTVLLLSQIAKMEYTYILFIDAFKFTLYTESRTIACSKSDKMSEHYGGFTGVLLNKSKSIIISQISSPALKAEWI